MTHTHSSYLNVNQYDYNLPDELIARYPLTSRSDSRLLYLPASNLNPQCDLNTNDPLIFDKQFTELPSLLNSGDLIVFNDTKVMKARLFGQKDTGGKVEVLVERLTQDKQFTLNAEGTCFDHVALCHVRASKAPKIGQELLLANNKITCQVIGRHDNLFIISFSKPILPDLEQFGELPIPPYFERHADETDNTRYQTVFHDPSKLASVAAPTASLHFDDNIINTLRDKGIITAYVTLHVGAGTFAPVKTDNLLNHKMHSEFAHLPKDTADLINQTHERGNRVIAVGTTVTRVLETAFQKTAKQSANLDQNAIHNQTNNANHINNYIEAWSGDTDIFIYPGYTFGVVDILLTNFHLPKSTLLMLVSAFAGKQNIDAAYQHAIEQKYRFFSYGDAMLLERQKNMS